MDETDPPIRVMALHALAYCERLFYLEEVEEIRVADEAVFAGRTLHEELTAPDPSGTEWRSFRLESERLGLVGQADVVRQRDGSWMPYEHKRGRPMRGAQGGAEAWASDRLQVTAYEAILDEAMAWLECEAEQFVPAGDHTLVIARVLDGRVLRAAEPLTSTYTGWTYSG